MLASASADFSRVLDLYAGTGALGIEALSRGAGWVDFVEQDPKCCAAIKENLERTGFYGQAHVYCYGASNALSALTESYTLVLADPPYSDPSIGSFLDKLASSKVVGPESTIVIEHSRRLPLEPVYGRFGLAKTRSHGDTVISIYRTGG